MSILDATAPPIGYVGGSLVGQVRVGTICNLRVCIHREFWFARDHVSDEWSAFVELPERDSDDAAGVGSILIDRSRRECVYGATGPADCGPGSNRRGDLWATAQVHGHRDRLRR